MWEDKKREQFYFLMSANIAESIASKTKQKNLYYRLQCSNLFLSINRLIGISKWINKHNFGCVINNQIQLSDLFI